MPIVAEEVWKRFRLQRDRADSIGKLLMRMMPAGQRHREEQFWALQEVSLSVPDGASVGIVGDNGSGKSTLLKLLTKTMVPTHGSIKVKGVVSALIELGAGFHPDFTGRENAILSGSILGLRRREIERKMDSIVAFAGISDFIDTPVKYYSSGMYARLGFSVAIHVEPQILIVDEVLSVGDESFQRKCVDQIQSMQRQGVSLVFVSHSMDTVMRLVDHAVWLDHGKVVAQGVTAEVVRRYRDARSGGALSPPRRGFVELARFCPLRGSQQVDWVEPGDPLEVRVDLKSNYDQPVLIDVRIDVRRPDGLVVMRLSTADAQEPIRLASHGTTRLGVNLERLLLFPGDYTFDVAVRETGGPVILDQTHVAPIQVRSCASSPTDPISPRWRVYD